MLIVLSAYANAEPIHIDCLYETYSDTSGLNDESFELQFILDPDNGEFLSVGNNGISEVAYISNESGFTLIEVSETGNVMVTAISNDFASVHSRHSMISGRLLPSQYYGICRPG